MEPEECGTLFSLFSVIRFTQLNMTMHVNKAVSPNGSHRGSIRKIKLHFGPDPNGPWGRKRDCPDCSLHLFSPSKTLLNY